MKICSEDQTTKLQLKKEIYLKLVSIPHFKIEGVNVGNVQTIFRY
jgi:hypothetical protein